MSRRRLRLGLSLSATWWRGGAWRSPGSRIEELFDPRLFIELAQRAEAAKLDFLFKPDAMEVDRALLAAWPGFASLDPLVMMTAVATHTREIGLVPTVSTTFSEPYAVARQLQSLDHVSGGRAGWNAVTSLGGERNHGLEAMPSSEHRYGRAEEFIEVVQRLCASWPAEAQLLDRAAGRYADVAQVRPIDHAGQHFRVAGPLSLPQHGPGRLPLLHAGGSEAARRLAGRQADAVFASARSLEEGQRQRAEYASLARAFGRPEGAVRLMPGLGFTLGRTLAEAEERRRGVHGEAGAPAAEQRGPHNGLVGTPDDAFRHVMTWFEAGAADGFILLPGGSLDSLWLFLDEVVPRLVEAGLFQGAYQGDSFAERFLR